jgi:hypothetical protein
MRRPVSDGMLYAPKLSTCSKHKGDWCSHGAGSAAQLSVQACDAAGGVANIGRVGDRAGLLGGSGAVNTEPVVRSAGLGHGDSGLRGCIVGAGVDGG